MGRFDGDFWVDLTEIFGIDLTEITLGKLRQIRGYKLTCFQQTMVMSGLPDGDLIRQMSGLLYQLIVCTPGLRHWPRHVRIDPNWEKPMTF